MGGSLSFSRGTSSTDFTSTTLVELLNVRVQQNLILMVDLKSAVNCYRGGVYIEILTCGVQSSHEFTIIIVFYYL